MYIGYIYTVIIGFLLFLLLFIRYSRTPIRGGNILENIFIFFAGSFPSVFKRTKNIVGSISECPYQKILLTYNFGNDLTVIKSSKDALELIERHDSKKEGFLYTVIGNMFGFSGNLPILDKRDPFYMKNKKKIVEFIYQNFQERFDKVEKIVDRHLEFDGEHYVKDTIYTMSSEIIMSVILDIDDPEIADRVNNLYNEIVRDFKDRPYRYFIPYFKKIPLEKNIIMDRKDLEVEEIIRKQESKLRDIIGNGADGLNCMKVLYFAGFETIACTLCWALYYISDNMDLQNSLHDEILNSKEHTDLKLLKSVIMETLRLKPPVNVTCRKVDNTENMFFTYGIHRDPDAWKNPEEFMCKRFIGAQQDEWMPFQKGKRQCIGKEFALHTMVYILSQICSKYKMELLNKDKIYQETQMVLELKPDIRIRFIKRDSSNKQIKFVSERKIVKYKGNTVDLSDFKHPGGDIIINGSDVTESFHSVGHSDHAKKLLEQMIM